VNTNVPERANGRSTRLVRRRATRQVPLDLLLEVRLQLVVYVAERGGGANERPKGDTESMPHAS
jgi:hypothetical protein